MRIGINALYLIPGGVGGAETYLRALDAIDRDWTYSVYRRFFERWAAYPDRDADGEVVYSPARSGKVQLSG